MARVALAQMEVRTGRPDENMRRARELVMRAAGLGADIVLLPELWLTGFPRESIHLMAETLRGRCVRELVAMAREAGAYIIGSIPERRGGRLYNTATVVGPGGLLGCYRKMRLSREMGEALVFSPGRRVPVFEAAGLRFSVAICRDIKYPEIALRAARKGARALFVVAAWHSSPRVWESLLVARAVEAGMYVAAVNRVGRGRRRFIGLSMAVDPRGEVLIRGGDREEVLVCEIPAAWG